MSRYCGEDQNESREPPSAAWCHRVGYFLSPPGGRGVLMWHSRGRVADAGFRRRRPFGALERTDGRKDDKVPSRVSVLSQTLDNFVFFAWTHVLSMILNEQ